MVKDAEANKAEDHKRFELAQARNAADSSVHQIRKSLTEHGDKLEASEKESIEAAIKDVEEALKADDKDAIEAKTATLMTASQKLGEKMYAEAQQAAGAGAAQQQPEAATAGATANNEDVVDADFKEVKRG